MTDSSSPVFYWEVEVLLSREQAELWNLFCQDQGSQGAEIIGEEDAFCRVRHFFSEPPANNVMAWPTTYAGQYPGGEPPQGIRIIRRETENWLLSWREHFHPTPVGDSLIICPPWALEQAGAEYPHRLQVVIDPGQGFGTGGHPTTLLVMELLEGMAPLLSAETTCLDVGTGSGVLALATQLLGVRRVFGMDTDHRVFPEVRRNASLSGINPPPLLVQGAPGCLAQSFGLVLANLTAPILLDYDRELHALVAQKGWMLISGVLSRERDEVLTRFQKLGMIAEEETGRDGWWACRFQAG